MDSPKATPKALLIAGMHRSGTSLLASLLQASGLNLGERLLPGVEGNNRPGFFENADVVEFHEKVLASQGVSRFGWTLNEEIEVPANHKRAADELVHNNASPPIWGFKDPRTTLFLDFWHERLPDPIFLFVHRAPWEVVDSLYRRGDQIFQDDPVLALKIWHHYNRKCLDFVKSHKEICELVALESIFSNPELFIDHLNQRFGLKLSMPEKPPLDRALLTTEATTSHRPQLIRQFFPETYELFAELKRASVELSKPAAAVNPDPEECKQEEEDSLEEFVLNDWMAVRKADLSVKKLEATLYEVRSELYHTKERLAELERSRIWKLRNAILRLKQQEAKPAQPSK